MFCSRLFPGQYFCSMVRFLNRAQSSTLAGGVGNGYFA